MRNKCLQILTKLFLHGSYAVFSHGLLTGLDSSPERSRGNTEQIAGISTLNWDEIGEGEFPQNWGDTVLHLLHLADEEGPSKQYYETQELMIGKEQAYGAIKLQSVHRGRLARKKVQRLLSPNFANLFSRSSHIPLISQHLWHHLALAF